MGLTDGRETTGGCESRRIHRGRRHCAGGVRGSSPSGNAVVSQVGGPPETSAAYPGALLFPRSYAKPTVSLEDTAGDPYNIASATSGELTLVYFGYTHCPDLCPLNMETAATALQRLPRSERSHVKVVFVTTDPNRDTPSVIRIWLDHFDPTFIGLTGSIAQIQQTEAATGIPLSFAEHAPRQALATPWFTPVTSWSTRRTTGLTWNFQPRSHRHRRTRTSAHCSLTGGERDGDSGHTRGDSQHDEFLRTDKPLSVPMRRSMRTTTLESGVRSDDRSAEGLGGRPPLADSIRTQRVLQIVLGLLWIFDAALQYQPFMFGNQFVPSYITANAAGQPEPVAWLINNAGHFISPNVGVSEHALRHHPARHRCRSSLPSYGAPRPRDVLLLDLRCVVFRRGPWQVTDGHGGTR